MDAPGATQTTINGINDFGNIVGFFQDAAGNTNGLAGSPLHGLSDFALAPELVKDLTSGHGAGGSAYSALDASAQALISVALPS